MKQFIKIIDKNKRGRNLGKVPDHEESTPLKNRSIYQTTLEGEC
jgi:hypothetical protein